MWSLLRFATVTLTFCLLLLSVILGVHLAPALIDSPLFAGASPSPPPRSASASPSPPPRGLVLIIGEHGRSGGQGSRARGSRESYFEQHAASASHVGLAWHVFRRHGVVCDFAVLSYDSPYARALCDFYARGPGALTSCDFLPEPIGIDAMTRLAGEATVLNASRAGEMAAYGFVLLLRADLILKRLFLHALDPFTPRITFSHNAQFDPASNGGGRLYAHLGGLVVTVGGTTVLVPRDLWTDYFDARSNYHDTWAQLERRGVPRTRLGFMIPTLHDADSAKDWVPMYRIAGRTESCDWQSPGWIFDAREYDATGNVSTAYRKDDKWATRAAFWDVLGVDDTCPPERPAADLPAPPNLGGVPSGTR